MAGFSSSNGYLGTLISNSADAQGNLYILNITADPAAPDKGIKEITTDLKVRTKSFDWTPPSQDAYEVKFLTAKINRPTAFVKVTHNFSFNVRVDSQYEVYKALLTQQGITFNPKQHWALNDINSSSISGKLFDLTVSVIANAVTSNTNTSNIQYLVGFEDCWITAIDPIAFKTGEASPVEVKVSCAFKYLNDQWNPVSPGDVSQWLGAQDPEEGNRQ